MGFSYDTLFTRSSGVLMHISSLPGRYGIGDLGKEAYQFVDFLHAAEQRLWQVLPLTPTGYGNSPYYSYSAMACNHLLLSIDALVQRGYLSEADVKTVPKFPDNAVDFEPVVAHKIVLLQQAFHSFVANSKSEDRSEYRAFCAANKGWLDDYALFTALKLTKYAGQPWNTWDKDLRLGTKTALDKARKEYDEAIRFHKFLQYEFSVQWQSLRAYANSKGVAMVGDIPIFVAYDSADVWSNQTSFRLDKEGMPTVVAGVPPDYFSATGQLWGNPHYNWDVMEKDGYAWWGNRFAKCFELFDIVRVDHFRGFEAFWEVPADEKTAINGTWVKAPGVKLFTAMKQRFEKELGELPVIAEDLGLITEEVTALRKAFNMPGMKILQFGYESGDPADAFLPHNYERDSVTYTGTHDNDTTLGWFRAASEKARQNVLEYLRPQSEEELVWEMIRAGMFSTALFSIFPMQDVLTLDGTARMNFPGKADGNWAYRLQPGQVQEYHITRLAKLVRMANRLAPSN